MRVSTNSCAEPNIRTTAGTIALGGFLHHNQNSIAPVAALDNRMKPFITLSG